ncbi:Hypothetical protein (Partial), partial [Ectocarpus siliculosus]
MLYREAKTARKGSLMGANNVARTRLVQKRLIAAVTRQQRLEQLLPLDARGLRTRTAGGGFPRPIR